MFGYPTIIILVLVISCLLVKLAITLIQRDSTRADNKLVRERCERLQEDVQVLSEERDSARRTVSRLTLRNNYLEDASKPSRPRWPHSPSN